MWKHKNEAIETTQGNITTDKAIQEIRHKNYDSFPKG